MTGLLINLAEKFSSLDIVGPYPEITHKGYTRFRTILGSLLTLLCFGVCLVINYDIFEDVYNELKPSIFEQAPIDQSSFTFNRSDLNIKMYFKFVFFDFSKKVFTPINNTFQPKFRVENVFYNDSTYIETNLSNSNNKFTYLDRSCIDSYFTGEVNLTQSEIEKQKAESLCLPSYINEQIGYVGGGLNAVGIAVPAYEIYKAEKVYNVSKLWLQMFYQELILSPGTPDQPYKMSWTYKNLLLKNDQSNIAVVNIQKNSVSANRKKFIMPNLINSELFSVGSVEVSEIALINFDHSVYNFDDNLLYIFLNKSPKSYEVKIIYKSYETLFGNIGGTLTFFLTCCEIIMKILVTPFRNVSRLTAVVEIHENLDNEDIIKNIIKSWFSIHSNKKNSSNFHKSVNTSESNNPPPDKAISKNDVNTNEESPQSLKIRKTNNQKIDSNFTMKNLLNTLGKNVEEKMDPDSDRKSINFETGEEFKSNNDFYSLENIERIINNRKKVDISYFEFFKKTFFLPCKSEKSNAIFDTLLYMMDSTIDEIQITKSLLELKVLGYALLGHEGLKLLKIPSVNYFNQKNRLFDCRKPEIECLNHYDRVCIAKHCNLEDSVIKRLTEVQLRSLL